MIEEWKDIPGYEGLYQISNLGRVKSLSRWINTYRKGRVKKVHYVAITDNGNGYKIVSLSKDKKRKNKYVHRLVAEAFIDNPQQYKEINHIDNDTSNNRVDNLEWCDRWYNVIYSYVHNGRIAPKNMLGRKGKEHPISKPVKQYDLEGNFIKEYESANLASIETGVCCVSIKKCRCGKQHTAGGYVWA